MRLLTPSFTSFPLRIQSGADREIQPEIHRA